MIEIWFVVILTVSRGSYLNPVQSCAYLKVRNCQIWQSGSEGLVTVDNAELRRLTLLSPANCIDCLRSYHEAVKR